MALSVDIQKQLGAFRLHVQFETDGGTLGLLGASGCGKSVTLQCIAGIMKPDRGRIVLNGRVLFDSERHIHLPPQKRAVGYLFQQYALFPNMTVEQNILAGVRSGSRAEKRETVLAALHAFHLESVAKQHPVTLSGGQQQRTALARILVGKPELLLLDEPFSALDETLREQLMWELTRSLEPFDGDVLFVSHDRTEMRRFCRSVCVLDAGRSEPVQPAKELLSHPHSVAAARLAGFYNLAPAERIAPDRAFVPAWGIELAIDPNESDFDAVCMQNNALALCEAHSPGAFCCSVVGTSDSEDGQTLLLHPIHGSPESTLLLCKSVRKVETNNLIWVSLAENRAIFCLKSKI